MSDTEKIGNAVENSSNSDVDQLVDPDAGLSDEERLVAVCPVALVFSRPFKC